MKKLLVASDSHGDPHALLRCIQAEPDAACLIFLGDGASDLDAIFPLPGRKLPVYAVAGNCDYDSALPLEGLAAFEGTLFFYTHGHQHGVKYTLARLSQTAGARGADVALCGHTHVAGLFREKGFVSVFNPGSVSRPKGGQGASYGVITLQRGEEPVFEIKPVPQQKR